MKCLVVIDMQWYFASAQPNWLIDNVVNKIEQYIRNMDPVIVVQYKDPDGEEDLGPTIPEILETIRGYQRAWVISKFNDDGAEAIDCHLREIQIYDKITEFEVCGVNLDCCVAETVATLGYDYAPIPVKVNLRCCNSSRDIEVATESFNDMMGWREIGANVELIGEPDRNCMEG